MDLLFFIDSFALCERLRKKIESSLPQVMWAESELGFCCAGVREARRASGFASSVARTVPTVNLYVYLHLPMCKRVERDEAMDKSSPLIVNNGRILQ